MTSSAPFAAPPAGRCFEWQAPSGTEAAGTDSGVVAWTEGVAPQPRPLLPGYDDGVTSLVAAIFILLAVSVSRHTTFLKTFASALLSGRRAQNTFDDEHTVDESRITAALLLVCCVCEGIIAYFAATLAGADAPPFATIAAATAGAALLMGCQTAAYVLTGYAFAPRQGDTRQWLRGFFASQSLLGLCLAVPALALLFYPGAAMAGVGAGAALYIIARLMFITKGFRFFYTNMFSLVYFILYLCTLEIVPVIFLCRKGFGFIIS